MPRSLALLTLWVATTASGAEPVTLGKLAATPDVFDAQVLQADASIGMIVSQRVMSKCRRKETALMIVPPIAEGPEGAESSVSFQACLDRAGASALGDVSDATTVTVVGTVRVVRAGGALSAIVFDNAKVMKKAESSGGAAPVP